MKKEMLINVLQPEECRIAIVEDGVLEELYVERTSHESYTGNIYKGKIVNLEPAIQAAFVDFSVGRNGFLHVSDVEPQYYRRREAEEGEAAPPREPRRERSGGRDGGRRGRGHSAAGPAEPREPLPPPDYPEERPERERPDRSEKKRERPDRLEKKRDRPRRFGEGLVGEEDLGPPPPPPPARSAEPPQSFAESEPTPESDEPAPRRRSEANLGSWAAEALGSAYPASPVEPPMPAEPRGRAPRSGFDPEVELPPSRTARGRTQPPPRPLDEDEPAPFGPAEVDIEPAPPRDREPRRGRGGRFRARTEEELGPEPPAEPAFGEEILPEPGFEDRAEPPRRRGGRDAIRSRGGDREPPRERERPRPVIEDRAFEPEPDRPHVSPPERTRPAGPAARAAGPDRPERRHGPEAERPPRERDRDRDRDSSKPIDRAGEEGYIPRRMRSSSSDAPFGGEVAPAEWPDLVEDRGEDVEAPGEAAAPTQEDRGPRRRRRRRRGERDRPARDTARPAPGDLDFEADETVPALGEEEAPHGDDFDFGEEPRPRARRDVDDELIDEDEEDVVRAPAPDEDIDPELEEEIRKEIEEIAELEREMGLRATTEARPRRGDRPAAADAEEGEAEPGRGGRGGPRGRGIVKPPIQEIFRRGDEVLIQVIKESIGTKGPTLSTYISIPGRYLVLMPGLNRVGVSRKIADEGQRRKLREIMNELNPPKGLGFIVRTAGLDRSKRDLARDLAYLLRLWKVILRRIKKAKGPTPIYQESDMITRTIRDIFNAEIDTIWIDEPAAFERAHEFLRVVMPRFVNRLKLFDEKVPIFHKYGIEDEIAKIQRRRVEMPMGGSIVIDQTEALVAIDVNSGNFRVENDAERTAYEMNLRAAKEIARQLRLRDLGGVIVNDFIDMRDEKNRRGVEKALRDAIKRDRARTKILRMSQFGLIEMTRQRIRPSLKRSVYEDCSHCNGLGQVKTVESMSIDVMRLLALAANREEVRRVNVGVCPTVAAYLNNRKRRELARIEVEANLVIHIRHEVDAPPEHLQLDCFDANNNEIRVLPQPAPPPRRGR